ncbi:MAG: DUF2169 domain-containing protein [Polyangiaceae bacterium]
MTVHVKVTFALALRDPAPTTLTLRAPEPLLVSDSALGDRLGVAPSDLAPSIPYVDVVLHADAVQAGAAAPSRAVTLSLYRERTAVLSKTLHVFGDRQSRTPNQATPFESMPMTWERAVGDDLQNPVGAMPGGPRLPNVVSPKQPLSPAGFQAVPRVWPVRARLLRGVAPSVAGSLEPVWPSGCARDYYQSAPIDQRIDKLSGDEWIVLDGVSRTAPRVQTRLPGIRALARVLLGESITALSLKPELLLIDAQRGFVSLTFRGECEHAPGLAVSATIEGRGVAPDWRNAPPAPERPAFAQGTLPLDEEQQRTASARAAAPFELGEPKRGAEERTAPAVSAPHWVRPASDLPVGAATLPLDEEPERAAPRRAEPAPRPLPPEPVHEQITVEPVKVATSQPERQEPIPSPRPRPPKADVARSAPPDLSTEDSTFKSLFASGMSREAARKIARQLHGTRR